MNDLSAIFRSLIIYAACVVLAVWLGYMLANPLSYSQLLIYGILAFILVFPVLLRWHYPLMLLSWHLAMVAVFIPGRPSLCLVMIVLSLGVSILQRMLSKDSRLISVRQLTLPIFFMLAVIAVTAKITGVGLHAFGSSVYGGKKYVYLVAGILGYFALSARRIPLHRKNLYLRLFFWASLTAVIGDLVSILPRSFYFIYWLFDFNQYGLQQGGGGTRLYGTMVAATGLLSYMLARHGLRGIFLSRRPLRWLSFFLLLLCGMFGGFRGFILTMGLLFAIQFFLEGLYRTKLLPILLFAGTLGAVALVPLAPHLPYTWQRTLSVLPYNVSETARLSAQQSSDWRIRMWEAILPQVPQYLLLGKGYVLSPVDYEFVMGPQAAVHNELAQNNAMALAENFHNGPLSIIIPFGIWGVLAFLWFLAAGIRVLYLNYRYSDPELQTLNTFLLADFLMQALYFLAVYGNFSKGMLTFGSLLGLSVAFNGGVRRRVPAPRRIREEQRFQRPVRVPASPVPAFQQRG